jgi:hypothetical protein
MEADHHRAIRPRPELAIIDYDGTHALAFPCRRFLHGWINAETKKLLDNLRPTHWREWQLPTGKMPD